MIIKPIKKIGYSFYLLLGKKEGFKLGDYVKIEKVEAKNEQERRTDSKPDKEL